MKCHSDDWCMNLFRRSREGAWIEIPCTTVNIPKKYKVAPVRERGLKFDYILKSELANGRSREGAWIEIAVGK